MSVVVCAYTEQRSAQLDAALASIDAQTVPAHEVVLVVDHNPALAAWARARYDGVRVVENRYGRGLSGARNTGAEVATGEVVAFLDDDARAAPDWLKQLLGAYGPGVLGVGGVAAPVWAGERPGWFPAEFDWVVGCTYLGLPESAAPVRNLIGANMSLRREVLASVDGFAESLGRVGTVPVGCEETELCIRAAARFPGCGFVFDPRARVDHDVSADRATVGYFIARCFAEGRSKAIVARKSGTRAGLASERAYSLRTLPRGFSAALASAVRDRDKDAALRAIAIAAGLAITAAGYLRGIAEAR